METLLCDNNPLQVPPVGVCNQGIQSIRSYYHAMDKTKNIHSKRLKVLILGQSMAGKTSLVKMLMEGESTQINEDDRTFGVVFYNWKPEPHVDELELMVIDCAGQKAYQMTPQLLLSEGALFILVVNLFRYVFENSANYHEEVAQWISLVASRVPKAKIPLVPTHVDLCRNEEEIDLKCRNIVKNMKEQREEMLREIIENVKRKLEHCVSSDEKSKIMKQLQEQKDKLPVLSLHYKEEHENLDGNLSLNVIAISNKSLAGTLRLRRELVRIARDKNLFPYVDITLPESWMNVEKEIKALRKSLKVPCLAISELHEL
ncbi:malignant fibrous histiocytoma-amplified sequence 1 homolog [Xenia sp. Carnegie-2017]|uniref:malignant fibrous histiocytoma-amplified sequence 1 homolog n=1 Tax=Xenia sp. Carnegie-2017 TaxID=2897299 RepID=UPI001F0437D9|nr:malignant fibrous histiocytoma-amplified sequence 1 homolog [Xenia sp. Carnegie-2017]